MGTKESLEKINEVSRQLLSRIQSIHMSIQSPENNVPVENSDDKQSNTVLANLVSTRKTLITHLFEHHTAENISVQAILLQEMLALDTELTINSTTCKQEIAEQVLNLKKSKKVTKSYQKY
jgi:hypothetical protein